MGRWCGTAFSDTNLPVFVGMWVPVHLLQPGGALQGEGQPGAWPGLSTDLSSGAARALCVDPSHRTEKRCLCAGC